MTDPLFREPELPDSAPGDQQPEEELSGERRWGRGYQRSPEQAERRLHYLESIGRRCAGWGGNCVDNAATRELTVVALKDGKPDGEPYKVLTCSRHQPEWTKAPDTFEVLNIERLPPRTDHVQMRNPADKRRSTPR